MIRTSLRAAVCATPLAILLAPALAQTTDDWAFRASINGYLPDIGGSTTFPQTGVGSGVTIDAKTIIENLKMTFMGSIEASRGGWGLFTDVLYMDVGTTRTGFREITIGGMELPLGAAAKVDYDLKGWIWTSGGVWHVHADPASSLDVVAGARLLDIKQTLGWEVTGNVGTIPLPGRAGVSEVGLTNWDAIVGVKGRWAFGEGRKWFVPYYADIGAGESKLTLQALGGVGYGFGWGEVVGVWRYIDYEMKSGGSVESLSFSGPQVSAVFRW